MNIQLHQQLHQLFCKKQLDFPYSIEIQGESLRKSPQVVKVDILLCTVLTGLSWYCVVKRLGFCGRAGYLVWTLIYVFLSIGRLQTITWTSWAGLWGAKSTTIGLYTQTLYPNIEVSCRFPTI